ncbi:helix-turn-helix transcriptional regulator [Burkholderia pseudomallei]
MQANLNVIRMRGVMEKTGLSRSGVYYAIQHAGLPKPIALGRRAAGWVEQEIDAWIKSRVDARQ